MESLVPVFARTPYVSPQPSTRTPRQDAKIVDRIDTLFVGVDRCLFERNELERRLQMMDKLIPQIENLQSNSFPKGAQPNIHNGSTSIWREKLIASQVHLFSLSPVPNLDGIELNELLSDCLENKISPDRAAWAVHHYVQQLGVSAEVLTNTLTSEPRFLRDPFYFSKLAYELYSHSLVRHIEFLQWMLANVKPHDMGIFNSEIVRTHSLLWSAFSQSPDKAQPFIEHLKLLIQKDKVQLIQFAVLRYLGRAPFAESLDKYCSEQIHKRAQVLCHLATSMLAFSSMFRNLLFSEYPYFHKDRLIKSLESMTCFCSEQELQEFSISMCRAVLWFESCSIAVASVVAFMIKQLEVDFPLAEFAEFLLDHADEIEKFTTLFVELQYFGVVDFSDFWHVIARKGLFYSNPEVVRKLALVLPCVSRKEKDLVVVNSSLRQLFPGNRYDRDTDAYLNDIHGNVAIGKSLPFVIRFLAAQYFVCGPADFETAVKVIADLDVPWLLVELFKRKGMKRVPLTLVHYLLEMVPVFSTHDLLRNLVMAVVSAPDSMAKLELANILSNRYRQAPCVSEFKSQLLEVTKVTKLLPIDQDDIALLARNHSSLFGLHTLDACFAVKTARDFANVMQAFFADWFSFDLLDASTFFDFFVDFSASNCIANASNFFIKWIVTCVMKLPHLLTKTCVQQFFGEFLAKVFEKKLIQPSQFLLFVLSHNQKSKTRTPEQVKSAEILLGFFYRVLSERPDLFSVNDILTENVVKCYLTAFGPSDSSHLADLLQLLRNLPVPIITSDMMKLVDCQSGTQFGEALFSLLPARLQTRDLSDAIEYFCKEVDRKTSTMWTLWLKLKPYYNPGFPVVITTPDREALNSYRTSLISSFSSLLFRADPHSEKTLIFLNCWTLLCQDVAMSKTIADMTINDLKSGKLSIYPMLIDFLHPSLLLLADKTFESLCDGFCTYRCDESQLDIFARTAASVFTVYVSRFRNDRILIPSIAEKLLEWLPKLYDRHSPILEFIVDVFDFVMCFTYQPDREGEVFQDILHARIKNALKSVPKELQDIILLNHSPQMFKPTKQPLFADFTIKPPTPPSFSLTATFQPDTNDSVFIFEDDYQWM